MANLAPPAAVGRKVRQDGTDDLGVPTPTRILGALEAGRRLPVKARLDLMAEVMRSHRCGPPQDGALSVTEDEDRYTMWMDPCGSGGRMRRGDAIDGTPSRFGPPSGFGVTSKAYPWSWGKEGVPYDCLHCANMEILSIEWGDAPLWVTEYSDDHQPPGAWHFYKGPKFIAEACDTRLGRRQPQTTE